jgi:acyl dehydratase
MLGSKIAGSIAHGFYTSTIAAGQELSNHRPARQYFLNHVDFLRELSNYC